MPSNYLRIAYLGHVSCCQENIHFVVFWINGKDKPKKVSLILMTNVFKWMNVMWLKPINGDEAVGRVFFPSIVCALSSYFSLQVHGKCMCKHNTAGTHCQHCAPLYNDRPWEAADGKTGSPNECRSKYKVHGLKSLLC